ncbi:MAG: acyltransferase [Oscillatoriales cyanobacterium SM2_2_1]|nr:acyltransferase [Oscillatoriales cyanobacterium SM2_2_1]
MNPRLWAGSILSYGYNFHVSNIPSRQIRSIYLRAYLGGYGDGAAVQMGCRFLNGKKVFLGDRTVINFSCLLDGRKYEIRTGHDVSIGPEATILTLGHDPQSADFSDRGGDVLIGSYVWIAYRAIILPGVTLGDGVVVAAGAVVTRSCEPFSIVAGCPAKVIGYRNPDLTYRLEYAPWLL